MKKILVLAMALTFILPTASAFAADQSVTKDDGGFGGSTYFTAQAPAGLDDTAVQGRDFAAEEISKIEPAAGGDNVFTLPEDPSLVAKPGVVSNQILVAPSQPIIPGAADGKTTK